MKFKSELKIRLAMGLMMAVGNRNPILRKDYQIFRLSNYQIRKNKGAL